MNELSRELISFALQYPRLFPDIEVSKKKIDIRDRVVFSISCILIYLILKEIPIYGWHLSHASVDYFMKYRLVVGSSRGTLMELGLTPILTAGMTLHLISCSQNNKHPILSDPVVNKISSIVLYCMQSLVYVMSGVYGSIRSIGSGNATLIVTQLVVVGLILVLFEESHRKGYGISSSFISLTIAINTSSDVIWQILSPVMVFANGKSQFIGIVPALFQESAAGIMSTLSSIPSSAVLNNIYRVLIFRGAGLSSVLSVLATVLVSFTVIYILNFKVCVPLIPLPSRSRTPGISNSLNNRNNNNNAKNGDTSYYIPLLYTGTVSIMLYTTITSNLYMVSQYLYNISPNHGLVRVLGVWSTVTSANQETIGESGIPAHPVSGILYYIIAPESTAAGVTRTQPWRIVNDPVQAIVYCIISTLAASYLSKLWIEMERPSSVNVKGIANSIRSNNLTIKGHRDQAIEKELSRYIPTAVLVGGAIVGFINAAADLTGALGSGAGLILTMSTFHELYQTISKEKLL